MKKTLIIAGGGHAHMQCLANLEKFVQKGIDAIVIGPSPYHYYSGMGYDDGLRVNFNGRLAFVIKDHIDRKFMKKFQAVE